MAVSARKVEIDNEGELVEVHLWVSRDGATEISIDTDGSTHFDVVVASEVAEAIKSLIAWGSTPAGEKKIRELVAKEIEADERRARPARQGARR